MIEESIYKSTSSDNHQPSFKNIPANKEQNRNITDQESLINHTLEIPRVEGLNNIAGLWEVKKILKSLVVLPRNQPQLFVNRKAFNSILLFGPPGTGKTQLIHALAFQANANLHCVSVSDILTPMVGQSEK